MAETKETLTQKKCRPCEGEEQPMDKSEADQYLQKTPNWTAEKDGKQIVREFTLNNFREAVDLFNKVANLAEEEQHHPDLHVINYKKLRIELSTHKIGGLSQNDFIVAAKINALV